MNFESWILHCVELAHWVYSILLFLENLSYIFSYDLIKTLYNRTMEAQVVALLW